MDLKGDSMIRRASKILIVFLGAIIAMGLVSCTSDGTADPTPSPGSPQWMEIELTDVATGETFKIGDFKGKPILLESFAVWCPTCLAQQKEVVSLEVVGGNGRDSAILLRRDLNLKSSGDLPCDLTLEIDGLHHGVRPIECFGPEVSVGSGVDELCGNAHTATGNEGAPVQQVVDPSQLGGYLRNGGSGGHVSELCNR